MMMMSNMDGVHVIREESGLDTAEHGVDDDTNWQQETCSYRVLNKVISLKPLMRSFKENLPCLSKELMTAAPPVNNMAVTRMLVMMPKTVKTLTDIRFAAN